MTIHFYCIFLFAMLTESFAIAQPQNAPVSHLNWQVGESYKYAVEKINNSTDEGGNQVEIKDLEEFIVTVIAKDSSGYTLTWKSPGPKGIRIDTNTSIGKKLMPYRLITTTYQIDHYGRFKSIVDWEKTRDQLWTTIDAIVALDTSTKNLSFDYAGMLKRSFSSQYTIEEISKKDIILFHYPVYQIHHVADNNERTRLIPSLSGWLIDVPKGEGVILVDNDVADGNFCTVTKRFKLNKKATTENIAEVLQTIEFDSITTDQIDSTQLEGLKMVNSNKEMLLESAPDVEETLTSGINCTNSWPNSIAYEYKTVEGYLKKSTRINSIKIWRVK